MERAIRCSSLAALVGLAVHYAVFVAAGVPLWTDVIAEWIMARTPSGMALWILDTFGAWAKPLAATGGLATVGFALFVPAAAFLWRKPVGVALLAGMPFGLAWVFEYGSALGQWSFWLPAAGALMVLLTPKTAAPSPARRAFLGSLMAAGTAAVAVESWGRDRALARRAVEPVELFPFAPPAERASFGQGLVRKPVTMVGQHYVMSKNTVDPVLDPNTWRLKFVVDGRVVRQVSYQELLAMPRVDRWVTLRCVSNTLKTDLMGTALWSGVKLGQLIERARLPKDVLEVAFIGVDGHGDSVPVDYAFSDEVMLAVGMNGKTLNRQHGFPVRLLVPRYYGFKNVKWIGEIAFVREPYFGTWPKMGYTKEPVIHTMSYIDRYRVEPERIRVGGVSFAGTRGIRQVEVRTEGGLWVPATLEAPLSPYTWTRWVAEVPGAQGGARVLEARAMDGAGRWQATEEGQLFPDGVKGPTFRKIVS
ncbi:MAG: molybdopterin-dependent oxidoreductase [Bryobacteraceae bacterium]|nr:molybdopterin-dependent oxidoreductase [Bryobacteraceae bacterium]